MKVDWKLQEGRKASASGSEHGGDRRKSKEKEKTTLGEKLKHDRCERW